MTTDHDKAVRPPGSAPVRMVFDRVLEPTNQSDACAADAPINQVWLPFDARQRSRLRVQIDKGPLAGLLAGIDLPRGTVMRAGTLVATAADQRLCVLAAPEQLIQVDADDAHHLTVIAYHLGNRHVPVQLGRGWLRLQQDHVLEQMVTGLGARVTRVELAFEPEAGAYGGGHHHHGHDHDDEPAHDRPANRPATPPDRRHAPKIHDLVQTRGRRDAPDGDITPS